MDTYKTILTKLELREYDTKKVPVEVKQKILEAARASGTGMNTQHWRFILVQTKEAIKQLADDSTSGRWVAGANFAVIIVTTPTPSFRLIDTGRAVQNMQLAAWEQGVISGIYTGFKETAMRKDFAIPAESSPTAVVAFGYPKRKIIGKKNRLPLSELAFIDRFGNKFDPKILG